MPTISQTPEEFTLTAREQKMVLALLRQSRARYDVYLSDCEDDRRNGYRPHYCRHGVSLWVDYDCACGRCEDEGNYWDYLTELSNARWEVRNAKRETLKRIDAMVAVSALGGDVSSLMSWCGDLMRPLAALVD